MNINALANNESSGTKCCSTPEDFNYISSREILVDYEIYSIDHPYI